MFGLEKQNKKKAIEEFVFELEKELKDPKAHEKLKNKIEGRVQKIKEVLRDGEDKEQFDQLGALLQGYTALLKVISRVVGKNKS